MEVFLARQPIFDMNQDVNAYEILYRSGNSSNKFDGIDGDEASREVLFNTFQTFGIENLTNGKPVFINFTESLINDDTATLFSKDLLVVEILEDVVPNEDVMERSKYLKEIGYRIALDDFVYSPEYEGLIELADIIKVDFLMLNKADIEMLSKELLSRDIKLLAEKVETREDFEYAKSLGFTLFQGYFFSKPEIVISKKLQPIRSTCLQLIEKVNGDSIDFAKIANIISMDLALSYNLFKLVNSAAFGFRYRIKSVRHAVVAIGEREIKKWIYLVVVNTIGADQPDELTRLSLIRGRFIELIALHTRYRKYAEELFLIGLFSLLDCILSRPIEDVLEELKASATVKEALITGEGELGDLYKMMLAYEAGDWDQFIIFAENLDIDQKVVAKAYIDALMWYNSFMD